MNYRVRSALLVGNLAPPGAADHTSRSPAPWDSGDGVTPASARGCGGDGRSPRRPCVFAPGPRQEGWSQWAQGLGAHAGPVT